MSGGLVKRRSGRRLSRLTTPDRNSGPEPKPAARDLMLDAAEELFGLHGINAVSLREIAAAAGQRNNNAVRYHFGDKEGLVNALIFDRIGKVERARQGLLDMMGDLSPYSATDLLRALWQPLLDLGINRGHHSFIRFLLAYQVQTGGTRHPIIADAAHHKASERIMTALHKRHAHLSVEQFQYRMALLAMMFWAAVSMQDHAVIAANQRWSTSFSLDETLRLASAALAAPA